jgi:hypothetical protein
MRISHYLFASKHNNYKPWIITPTALAIFCLIIWSLKILIPDTLTFAAGGIDAYDLMNKINNERTQRFIPALSTNTKLITASDGKARDMLERSYFAHVDPDGNYVWPRVEAAGYRSYLTLGENLAMDFTSANSVISAWMNSPTHRANIINEKFEDQGLTAISGAYEPQHDTIMVVSLFGTLYRTKSVPQSPTTPAPAKTPTAPAKPSAPVASSSDTKIPPPAKIPLTIYQDIKISTTTMADHTLINIDVVINGSPTLATARLKSQSITLKAGKTAGQYLGAFTFDNTEDLSKQTLTIEARDKDGVKITQDFPVDIVALTPAATSPEPVVPISNEATIVKTLRVLFAVFAGIYMIFLLVDAIIIHRNKVKREGIHANPHVLILLLVVTVSLFVNWT